MNKQQAGFTLIELVMVIVILGILAATALPRYVDLQADAQAAALQGVIGAANSSMAINYAGCSASNHVPAVNRCVAVADCGDVGGLMVGGVPGGYAVTAGAIGANNGTTLACTVTQAATGNTAQFTAIRAGT